MGEPIRVETIAQSGIAAVPSEYIQHPQSRPLHSAINSDDNGSIPLIDLLEFDAARLSDIRRNIGEACRDWGAFQVTNHGVPAKLLADMRRVGLAFFNDCSMEVKLKYSRNPKVAASEGYGSRLLVADNDSVLDWRDYFDHHTFPISRRNPSQWPEFPPDYRDVVVQYSDQIRTLAQNLLSIISESLGLSATSIADAVGEFYQNITISYYPPCPQPELTLGLQAHSDMGAITLLIQDDVKGLQVLKDGKWITVKPILDAIVVILADQTEIITNGEYRSAQHRAITNANTARLSVATFHDPAKTRTISPVPELLSKFPRRYRSEVYGNYVSSWYSQGPEGKKNIHALQM